MRYVTPLLFFAVAAYVWHSSGVDPHRAMVFPFLDHLDPTLRDDPQRWGRWSAYLFAAIGGVMLIRSIARSARARRS